MTRTFASLALASLLLAACGTPQTHPKSAVDEPVQHQEVVVSRDAACPADPATIPAVPKRIGEEHPTMPTNAVPPPPDDKDLAAARAFLTGEVDASHARERILGDKVLEQRTWIEKSYAIHRACAGIAASNPAVSFPGRKPGDKATATKPPTG